jgi:hypothetical protein
VVMDGYRQDLFRPLLANHVLIQYPFDLSRFWDIGRCRQSFIVVDLFSDDIVAKIDALITNIHRRAGNQLAHLVLALSAERADKIPRSLTVLWHRTPASLKFPHFLRLLSGRVAITSSTNPYSWACLPFIKRSRSVSFSIFFKLCPVCFIKMLFKSSRMRRISRA